MILSVFINPAIAQTEISDVSQVSLDQVLADVNDPKGKIRPYVENVKTKFEQMVAEITGENEQNPQQKRSRLEKEYSKLKIRYTFDEFENLIDSKYIKAGVSYQYVVEPAFRNNEQLRKDIWIIQAGATNAQRFSLGAGGEIRFTFSRFFKGNNAKLEAIKAFPYLPTQIPSNVNEVKEKLKDGDGFRFEINGSTSASVGENLSESGKLIANANVGMRKSALFIMDLYKVNNKVARTRFFGLKNQGELFAGIGVQNESPIDLISRKLNELLTLGFGVSFSKTMHRSNPYPIDSMMLDYLFQFSTSELTDLKDIRNRSDIAESALEQIFMNIKKGGFYVLFSRAKNINEVAKNLLSKAEIAEKLSAEDQKKFSRGEIPFSEVRVYSFFKGRMQANTLSFDINGKISDLLRGNRQSSTLTSFVTSFDSELNQSHFLLDNLSVRAGHRSMFGLNKYAYLFDFDVLITSNEKGEPGKISDIVIRNQFEDTTSTKSENKLIRQSLLRSLPKNYKNDPNIINFFPLSEQTNTYLSYRYSFSEPAFKAIQNLSRPEIAQRLFEYLDEHPNRARMHLEVDKSENNGGGLGTYAEQKAYEIYAIINPNNSNKESLEAYEIAKRDPIFEMYLVGEFFASLLPEESNEQLFNLDAKITSAETGTKTLKIGNNQLSNVYDAVSFLRSVINDRSLDLQMIGSTDHTGNTVFVPHRMQNQMKIPVTK